MSNNNTFGNSNAGFQAGIINGSVRAEFFAPPGMVLWIVQHPHLANGCVLHVEPIETPPNPSILIPFSRDSDFVDRAPAADSGTILDRITEEGRQPGSRAALVGLGGVG
jgi:hypothetical protein